MKIIVFFSIVLFTTKILAHPGHEEAGNNSLWTDMHYYSVKAITVEMSESAVLLQGNCRIQEADSNNYRSLKKLMVFSKKSMVYLVYEQTIVHGEEMVLEKTPLGCRLNGKSLVYYQKKRNTEVGGL